MNVGVGGGESNRQDSEGYKRSHSTLDEELSWGGGQPPCFNSSGCITLLLNDLLCPFLKNKDQNVHTT